MDCSSALRLLFVLPLIFIVSYLLIGLLFALVAAIWPYLLGGIAMLIGFALLAAKVS